MRIIAEDEVRRTIDSAAALAIARDTLVDQASGRSLVSTPSAMALDAQRFGGPRFKFKAASVGYLGTSGIRLVARLGSATDDNACNYVAVYDHRSAGRLVGLVSELWLSRIRTAAFGVAAVEALVPKGALAIGLFGTGRIADELIPLLSLAFSVGELKVLSRSRENTNAFVDRHGRTLGSAIRVGQSGEDVVAGSDLVFTLTESREPLVTRGWLRPGAVLCSMGSHNEVAYDVLDSDVRLVVDDPDYASEMGDGGAWIRAGHITHDQFEKRIERLACEYAADFRNGKRSDGRTTVALIQGMAIGDVAFASQVIRTCTPQ